MSDIFALLDTWNAIGTTFDADAINISNGAGGAPVGAAGSRVFRRQANGVDVFGISIDGGVFSRPSPSTGRAVYTWDAQDIDADTADFYLNYGYFADTNLPASARANVVWTFGYNVNPGGGRVVASEPTLALHFETYFHQSGTDPESVLEWHLQSVDTAGVVHRPISGIFPRDGASSTSVPTISIGVDVFSLLNYAGSIRIGHDFTQSSGNFTDIHHYATSGSRYSFPVNNTVVHRQLNAALTDYINLPFVSSRDSIAMGSFVEIQSGSVNATYNDILHIQLNSATLAEGQKIIGASATAAAGANVYSWLVGLNTTGRSQFVNQNLGGGDCTYETWCATSGGDPWTKYNINGGGIYGVGIDNSDADAFVISANNGLGTNNRIRIDANVVGLPTLPLKHNPVAVASLPSAATVGSGTRHYVTDAVTQVLGGTVTGGGSIPSPVYSDGSVWRIG